MGTLPDKLEGPGFLHDAAGSIGSHPRAGRFDTDSVNARPGNSASLLQFDQVFSLNTIWTQLPQAEVPRTLRLCNSLPGDPARRMPADTCNPASWKPRNFK